jgi:Protein of unknown function (DUF2786)
MNTVPRIRILAPANPKKPGSNAWHRFNLYKDGMTVREFLAAGGTRSDLHYDVDHKFIDISTLSTPSGTAAKPSSNREAALNRIRALQAKTVENGATEEEAMSAAKKAGELMDKYGIESTEAELRDESCVQGVHGAERLKMHESQWVAATLARYCGVKVWKNRAKLTFFGLPVDVEIATFLMRVIEGAMNRSWKEFQKSEGYDMHALVFTTRQNRLSFMDGMATRINQRLEQMLKDREAEHHNTMTGTSLVVVKNAIVTEQFAKLGMKLGKAKAKHYAMGSAAAYGAGKAAGDKVNLSGNAVTGTAQSKRIK